MNYAQGVFLEAFLTAMLVFVILMLAAESESSYDTSENSFLTSVSQNIVQLTWPQSALVLLCSSARCLEHFGQAAA